MIPENILGAPTPGTSAHEESHSSPRCGDGKVSSEAFRNCLRTFRLLGGDGTSGSGRNLPWQGEPSAISTGSNLEKNASGQLLGAMRSLTSTSTAGQILASTRPGDYWLNRQ